MQHNTETKIWNATLYLRLSRDDGDKEESNSITGQRELLRDFIRSRPELREYAVRIDDGFTGSNFERPSFKKMLEDVKAGRTKPCCRTCAGDHGTGAGAGQRTG